MVPPLAYALLALLGYAAVPRAYLEWQRRRLLRTCRRHRLIALTFDDGPGRQLTPLILDRLSVANVPATFFLLGRSADQNIDLVTAMQRAGHEVGSHGQEHVDHLRTLPTRAIADTATALARLGRMLGASRSEMSFRPPHGRLCIASWIYLLARGTKIASWTHDALDTRLFIDVPPPVIADDLRRSGGGIVLLHDFDRLVPNPCARVLARLDAVLALRREGFRFVRFHELLHVANGGRLSPQHEAPRPQTPMQVDQQSPPVIRQRRRRKQRHERPA